MLRDRFPPSSSTAAAGDRPVLPSAELMLAREDDFSQQAEQVRQLALKAEATRRQAQLQAEQETQRTRQLIEVEMARHPDILAHRDALNAGKRRSDAWSKEAATKLRDLQAALDNALARQRDLDTQIRQANESDESMGPQRQQIEQDLANLDNDARHLDQQIKSNDQQASQLQRLLEPLQREYSTVRRTIQGLEAQLNAINSKGNDESLHLDDANAQLERLKREDEAMGADYDKVLAQSMAARQDLALADRNVRDAIGLVEAEEQEARSLDDSLRDLPRRLSDYERVLGTYDDLLAKFDSLNKRITEQRTQKRAEWDALQTERTSIQVEMERLTRRLNQLDTLQTQIDVDLRGVPGQLERLQRDRDEAIKGRQETVDAITAAEANQSVWEERLGGLNQRMPTLQGQLATAVEERERLTQCIRTVDDRISGMSKERERLASEVNDVRTAVDTSQHALNTLASECDQLRQQLPEHEEHSQQVLTEMDDLKQRLAQSQAATTPKQEQLASLMMRQRDLHERLQSFPASRVPRLKQDLNDVVQLIERMRNELNACDAVNNPFALDVERLEQESTALEARIRDALARDPPSSLQAQLQREAEAVVRAEACARFEHDQQAVVDKATELAQWKTERTPRLELDPVATERMVRDASMPAGVDRAMRAVLDLAEADHIHSSISA